MTAPSTKVWRLRYKSRIVSTTLSDRQWHWFQDYRLKTGLNPSRILRLAVDALIKAKGETWLS